MYIWIHKKVGICWWHGMVSHNNEKKEKKEFETLTWTKKKNIQALATKETKREEKNTRKKKKNFTTGKENKWRRISEWRQHMKVGRFLDEIRARSHHQWKVVWLTLGQLLVQHLLELVVDFVRYDTFLLLDSQIALFPSKFFCVYVFFVSLVFLLFLYSSANAILSIW